MSLYIVNMMKSMYMCVVYRGNKACRSQVPWSALESSYPIDIVQYNKLSIKKERRDSPILFNGFVIMHNHRDHSIQCDFIHQLGYTATVRKLETSTAELHSQLYSLILNP
jgi:hypothetical protein